VKPEAIRTVENRKSWEGQTVDDRFQLLKYLGDSNDSAVFLTEYGQQEPRQATIKLIPEDPENARRLLRQWERERAAKLSHPHLLPIFEVGRCELDNRGWLYVVMEYADEDLSQVLAQRPITPAEAREMLEPVLDALSYIHAQGLVHGHVKPVNIVGVNEQLKLSSDSVCLSSKGNNGLREPDAYDPPEFTREGYSPAADIWSLGITLVEAMTQRLPSFGETEPVLPDTIPAPFFDIARQCLRLDPQRRCTAADILERLHGPPEPPTSRTVSHPSSSPKRLYVALVVALAVILAIVLAVQRFSSPPTASRVAAPSVVPEPKPPQTTPETAQPTAKTGDRQPSSIRVPQVSNEPGEVVHKVLPDVPRSARNTIKGKLKVSVRVHVDGSGNVEVAKLDSRGPSAYFAGLALKAARQWKFTPAKAESDWILRFEFSRGGTKAVPVLAGH
jgi:TonB family protein